MMPAEYARGFRAGVEAAAWWHEEQAARWEHAARSVPGEECRYQLLVHQHNHYAAAIRALGQPPSREEGK